MATGTQAPQLSVNTGAAGATSGGSQPGSTSSRYGPSAQVPTPQQTPAEMSAGYGRPSSAGTRYQQQQPPPPQQDRIQSPTYGGPPQQSPNNSSQPPLRDTYNSSPGYSTNTAAPPYPTHASERGPSPYAPGQTTGSIAGPPHRQYTGNTLPSGNPMSPSNTSNQSQPPPLRPVFGISLDELFNRDGAAVPLVVIQCILAVDTFGLETEGIYRISGTTSHTSALRSQFDNASPTIQPDYRNPANFFHDVNSVATLLKQFFRDLPDPLFTTHQYSAFIDAARIEDEGQRRDALHQGINDLPDPNYATLRALVLHLHRVMQNEARNRMGASNIALCFAYVPHSSRNLPFGIY